MPYYKDINLLFIHIPRTGGSSFEKYLRVNKKYREYLRSGTNNNLFEDEKLKKISLQHQTYINLLKNRDIIKNKLNIDLTEPGMTIISFIRNPYNRTISDLFFWKLIKKNSTPEEVFNVLKVYLTKDCYDNHNIPQYKFVTNKNNEIYKNIILIKTNVLTKRLNCLGFPDYYSKQRNVEKIYDNYLNENSIDLINNHFAVDFKMFNFKLKNTNNSKEKIILSDDKKEKKCEINNKKIYKNYLKKYEKKYKNYIKNNNL